MAKAYVLFAIALIVIAIWTGFLAFFIGFIGRMIKVVKFIFGKDPPPEKPKSTRKDYLN